ncbi:hypothetical protein ACFFV7_37720 [Nonomuraea spiralis]|uniref:Uncharacterized protein n=1 Tax=Nonomuraea spiralis TaxID=46182 RepID=A0ABV5IR40_9ACTN|nr:hypothetical protein [Nonomuraea spiralis]GGT23991.1 hypothetical protein GCM10010176_080600 [Nonomuraea spiralis]
MKRTLTGLALATTAALVAATPALLATPAQAAAPKNPVTAVKKQLVPGKGLKFSERIILTAGDREDVFVRRTGTLQFGKSGIAASDITGKFAITLSDLGGDEAPEELKALAKPERTIRIGTTSYLSGGLWSSLLPEGETWFKAPHGPTGGLTGTFGQPVNVAEQGTLKTLLKTAKPVSGGYAGTITVGALRKVSPWYRASSIDTDLPAKALKSVITWKLTVNAAGLPVRLVSTFPQTAITGSGSKKDGLRVDTRFTGWGDAVSIKAPTAEDVSSEFENGKDDLSSLDLPFGVSVAK